MPERNYESYNLVNKVFNHDHTYFDYHLGVSAKLSPGAPHGYGDFALVGGSYTNPKLLQFVVRGMFETGNEATERSLTVQRRYAVVVVASPRLVCL